MSIRIGSAIKRAVQKAVGNLEQTKSGLYLPPDHIAGRHFGGFDGYVEWAQDCIRVCCQMARGIGQDELSELTALALWTTDGIFPVIEKHAAVMAALARFAETMPHPTSLTKEAEGQVLRVDNARARGTLMVMALNPEKYLAAAAEAKRTGIAQDGKISLCVSAWSPAAVEEAEAVPQQRYLLG